MRDADIFHALVMHGKKITGVDIFSSRIRKSEYVRIRASIMTIMRMSGAKLPSIAKLFGCHHTGVMHHTQNHLYRMKTDEDYAEIYNDISSYMSDICRTDKYGDRLNVDMNNLITLIRNNIVI